MWIIKITIQSVILKRFTNSQITIAMRVVKRIIEINKQISIQSIFFHTRAKVLKKIKKRTAV